MPKISIIIPVYNGEKTIQETIQSVLKQTLSDFELIVVNDGSQDSTMEIVENLTDSRIKVLSYTNAGQATSRNRGFSHSIGEFIAFLDADDLWLPDKLDSQLKALQTNPEAGVAYSWTDYIDESGRFLRPGSHIDVSGDVYNNLLVTNFLENGSNPLIRRQALAEVGGFEGLFTPAEDWDMWLRLAARYQFVCVPVTQVLYRVSTNSNSSNVSKLEHGALQVINRAFTQAPPSLKYLKKPSKANLYKYLTFKSLEGNPGKCQSLRALKFILNTVSNQPSLLYKKIIWKVLLKIAIAFLLPPQAALALFAKLERRSNLEDLFSS